MSKASDISAFEHSVEPAPAETLFRDKKWTYIQDSTSNNGQYSGQIQFNLSTISSQAAFVNWEEAIIELPIKLEIKNATGSPVTSTAACTIDQLVSKAGAWQFIDSVQVVIDGTTVQTNQIHENVNATFKALTEWDYNTYLKQGQTSNFVIDEYSAPAAGSTLTQNIDNVTTSSYMNNVVGEFGLSNTLLNKGAYDRSLFTALDQQSNKLAYDIMGSTANIQAVSKPQVYVAPAGTVAAGGSFYVAHYLACIKLKDICDYFKKCPMQKNTRGFIYINYNSSSTTITVNITGTVAPGTISVSNNMNYGNTCPILWNFYSAVSTATLTPTGLAVPSSTVLTVTADVNGIPTSGSGIAPSQAFSRLLVPTYSPNPSADHALVQKKTFRYFERVTNKFTVQAGQAFTYTVTNGIANPKKLIMQPVITNPTAGSSSLPDVINPFRSPFSTVPATIRRAS
ncbi:hypothetical protein PC129_g18031 [Phytophthora cactorum]|uniref:Uncharacterized protein n=1 Tax=Phytophthora cactorum TaxID=29920 RepID=A0A329RIZ5_9STRA|nr:hypothetical protein Pcac1_g25982 [Phytophthora cactorum]KAG2802797.1 hypothetical protein PC112_g19476 [Phytophthora cactorum]KAG2803691.1 hypothetical protein PC111_g18581 [Phytophthora cactorum]KAG2840023.1 hypothetical protein PC113_g19349 [Phytophthora cactorum]KAG2882067.1 hypothetical protein PC114_g21221 [Phytophthora cactorum]